MNTYSPIFSSIVDSSLWCEEDYVSKAFITMLALKDSNHYVATNAFRLGRRCWPMLPPQEAEKLAIKALDTLCAPDTMRRGQEHEGRRLEHRDDGYYVLNGELYSALSRKVADQARKAKWARENRAKLKVPKRNRRLVHVVSSGGLADEDSAVRLANQTGDTSMIERGGVQ